VPPPPTDKGAALGVPLLLVNLKSYPNALGRGGERIGRTLVHLGGRARVRTAVAPATSELAYLARTLSLPVLAQHVDPIEPGRTTGFLVPEALRAAGARGSLLNHSEHPMPAASVGRAVSRLAALGLVPVVCAPNVRVARAMARFRPAYLAVEPPELIAGRVSVSEARPELIEATAKAVHEVSPTTRVLCGAGVHNRRDVERALELGSEGVLVASAVAAAKDPTRAIVELLRGFEPARSAAV
jgi:triosephosphate isomerase